MAFVWALTPLAVLLGNQPCSIARVLHRPCPGCGLTRATLLMLHGHFAESFAMHPLALPMILCWCAIAFATVRATWREGVPWRFHRERFGRFAVVVTGVAYVALFALWLMREHGWFGGPVGVES